MANWIMSKSGFRTAWRQIVVVVYRTIIVNVDTNDLSNEIGMCYATKNNAYVVST